MDHSADTVTSASTTWGGRKLFSPTEADRALVLVQRIAADIVAGYPELLELQEMLEEVQQHGPVDDVRRLQDLIAESVSHLQDYIVELDEVGVELRDFIRGVVDFPAERDGREIRLCWRFGEERVGYWHEIGRGLAERRPLEQYVPAQELPVREA